MPGIELSPQPMKTKLRRGSHGQVFVITSRNVPEYHDPDRAVLTSSRMIKIGDPILGQYRFNVPATPFGRLLYQCRLAKSHNRIALLRAIDAIRYHGFKAIDAV